MKPVSDSIYDVAIIGQGLSGTLMAYSMEQRGQSIFVFDAGHHTASFAAAGIINPITGRYFVKSWMFDELLAYAISTYRAIEAQLNIKCCMELDILRVLHSIKEENDWYARARDPRYSDYVKEKGSDTNVTQYIKEVNGLGQIGNAYRVDLRLLIQAYRSYLVDQNRFLKTEIESASITRHDFHYQIGDISAKKIIFCEGFKATLNPLFSHLPIEPSKGNVLYIKGDFKFDKNLRDRIFITPLEDGRHWVGSSYQTIYDDDSLDAIEQEKLQTQLDKVMGVPYQVVDRTSGIRPAVSDRRPILGRHTAYPDYYILNGFGTKGCSLGPYFADMLTRHILEGVALLTDVNIDRDYKSNNGL